MTNKSLINLLRICQFALMGKKQIKDDELLSKIVFGIKKLRQEKNITQEEFYNDTGIHISRVETGNINISVSTLREILKYFQISLKDFFNEIDM
jgi:DNA-binding XRE family transcriptional regulator